VIVLDTSALLALFNRADHHHQAAAAALDSDPGPYLRRA
jgi:predicted nucleic acid-binding protein